MHFHGLELMLRPLLLQLRRSGRVRPMQLRMIWWLQLNLRTLDTIVPILRLVLLLMVAAMATLLVARNRAHYSFDPLELHLRALAPLFLDLGLVVPQFLVVLVVFVGSVEGRQASSRIFALRWLPLLREDDWVLLEASRVLRMSCTGAFGLVGSVACELELERRHSTPSISTRAQIVVCLAKRCHTMIQASEIR